MVYKRKKLLSEENNSWKLILYIAFLYNLLGPLLIGNFINDVKQFFSTNYYISLYADDTAVAVSANTFESLKNLAGPLYEK